MTATPNHLPQPAPGESEAHFRAFMDNIPAIAFIKDGAGRYVYGNAAWARQFNRPTDELLGKTDLELWPPEAAYQFRASDEAVFLAGRCLESIESSVLPGGGRVWWNVIKFPLATPLGAPLLGGIVLDITERKKLEEQFLQAQKLESIGRLAGGVAHDFNNLLTVINGYCSLLQTGLESNHPWHTAVTEISRAAERAADLTRQLLAFSRKQMHRPRAVDLNSAVGGIERLLRRLIGEPIELVTSLTATRPVLADPSQLEQVLVNLAVNARDAMPQGGRLTLATRDVPAEEVRQHGRGGAFGALAVSDTGCGMDEATQAVIFEPFFTTKEVGQGTGLGLASVYGIVQQSGGFLNVVSAPGRGSTFTVYLPVAPEPAATVTATDEGLPPGRETVLLVEDEENVRLLCRQVLERCGYTVLEAANGAEALRLSADHPRAIDLLLTDVVMPHTNGRALYEQLAGQRRWLRVLFMSGYLDGDLMRHGALVEGQPFLHKPFRPAALARKVREVLDHGRTP